MPRRMLVPVFFQVVYSNLTPIQSFCIRSKVFSNACSLLANSATWYGGLMIRRLNLEITGPDNKVEYMGLHKFCPHAPKFFVIFF